jgi:hypothetical protein
MVIFRLAFLGFLIQLAGIVIVFRDFLPWLKSYTFAIPVVGKYLSKLVNIELTLQGTAIDFLSQQKKPPV